MKTIGYFVLINIVLVGAPVALYLDGRCDLANLMGLLLTSVTVNTSLCMILLLNPLKK